MSIDTRTYKINIVIRKNKVISMLKIKEYCETYFEQYAFISHLHDLDRNGAVEGPHYHIVGNLKREGQKAPRLATTLNKLVLFFGFSNSFGIEIEQYVSYVGSIQYLIHKNDKDKTQHTIDEIITNIDTEELKTIIDSVNDTLSVDRLWFIVESNCSFNVNTGQFFVNYKEIVKAIGFGHLQSKWHAIDWAIKQTEIMLRSKYLN